MNQIYAKMPLHSSVKFSKHRVMGLSSINRLEKFICLILKNGQKSKAYTLLYKTLNLLKKKLHKVKTDFQVLDNFQLAMHL